jgi:PAB-dependent poly(A)-specific ribonuclease subunit 2
VTSYINSVSVSPSGAYIAFGDAEGYIHMLSSTEGDEHVPWNGFDGLPVAWADPIEPLPQIDWDENTSVEYVMSHFAEAYPNPSVL